MNAACALRQARLRAGLTQRDLFRRTGVAFQAINRIERGRVTPRVDTLDRLLEGCGAALAVERRLGVAIDREPIRQLLELPSWRRLPFKQILALRILIARKVRFVAVGDLAARLQGAPVRDPALEIHPRSDAMNRLRLRKALERLSIRQHRPIPHLAAHGRQHVALDAANAVIWWSARGMPPYEDLLRAAVRVPLGEGRILPVASLDDLIAVRRASGRPADAAITEVLGAVRDESRLRPSPA